MVGSGLHWDDRAQQHEALGDAGATIAPSSPEVASDETVFSVIASRARSHSPAHLALTAVIGVIDAAALGSAHPGAWSVAAVFAAAGAYGLWGLLDRGLDLLVAAGKRDSPLTNLTRIVREMVAVLGFIAIVAAAAGLFGTTFNGWIS